MQLNQSCSAPSCFPKRQTHEEYREFMGLLGKKGKVWHSSVPKECLLSQHCKKRERDGERKKNKMKRSGKL
ncbi:hypothetical protein PGIGA_G00217610 [Pangasianodon gigas]|uniref:Uncharacterized protein n=1 Tax=Pangasianodon gigas TaxID=30993 RepID=A0ACC5WIU7_PANGG|nr:hypothetical protein [Pangasianodon gigas]